MTRACVIGTRSNDARYESRRCVIDIVIVIIIIIISSRDLAAPPTPLLKKRHRLIAKRTRYPTQDLVPSAVETGGRL